MSGWANLLPALQVAIVAWKSRKLCGVFTFFMPFRSPCAHVITKRTSQQYCALDTMGQIFIGTINYRVNMQAEVPQEML